MAYYTWKSYNLKIDPFRIFSAFKDEKNCFFLDSSLNRNALGRYSIIGFDPFLVLEAKEEEPFEKLTELLNRYKISASRNPFPFLGGAVGYLSYDLGFLLEKKVKRLNNDDLGIPDVFFAFYNTAIVIDNLKKSFYIVAVGFPEKNSDRAKSLCKSNLKKIEALISKVGPEEAKPCAATASELRSNFSRKDYLCAVKKVKSYIKAGDIYQLNLSQRFESNTNLSSFEIYSRLRQISPSNFSAYFDAGDFQIISSSPERFLKLEGELVETRPMKGTRPRGNNEKQDFSLRRELINSAKDKAELNMIVDLERNDLGKVCDYRSVEVTVLRELEKYSTVYQTTATIKGKLFKNKDRIDLLRAAFPGGSITGCPKIRAMEIIEELEPVRRSFYTGALGYLSFSGGMDFNILIRTILKKKGKLYFGVGGGIVADSKPEEEYKETLVKAKAMIEAINGRNIIFKR